MDGRGQQSEFDTSGAPEAEMSTRFRCPRHAGEEDLCPAKSVFACLSPAQDEALGRERRARRYEAGQVVAYSDTPALGVFSVHSGLVRLTRFVGDTEVVVGLRGPGELVGVREVLSGLPYQVSLVTAERSVLCTVPREAFLDAVRDCPELAMQLLGRLAKNYLAAEEQLVTRVHATVPSRTARFLLALGTECDSTTEKPEFVPFSKSREEIAVLIGTTRETLSRTLNELARQGAVQLENGRIRVLNQALLEQLAEGGAS